MGIQKGTLNPQPCLALPLEDRWIAMVGWFLVVGQHQLALISTDGCQGLLP